MRCKRWVSALLLVSILSGTMPVQATEISQPENEISLAEENGWTFNEIVTDGKSSIEIGDTLTISASVSDATDEFIYKFLWMKDGWQEWNVIQDFSTENSVQWTPEKAGTYYLYVDVKDGQGNIQTKSKAVTVKSPSWSFEGISSSIGNTFKVDTESVITAHTEGNTKGLTYKFVWMKDDWKEWGVLQNFSSSNSVNFTGEKVGNYTIIVDIKGIDGKVVSKQAKYNIVTDIWEFEGITTNPESPQEKYVKPIKIAAETSGETERLQYKFVWQKDNWKEWGVLQSFSSESVMEWNPKEAGTYTLIVDIKDVDGNVRTKSINYIISPVKWSFDDVVIAPETEQQAGEAVTIEAETSGTTTGLNYKFVWMKDNWKEWGVIKNFSADAVAEWEAPTKSGKYTILVDVKDRDGEVRTIKKEYYIATQIWSLDGININEGVSEQVYTNIPVKAEVSGNVKNLQYKYVWQKDDWASWGVIRDFSTEQEATWRPKEAGTYTIITNVKDADGRVKTFTQEYEVLKAPWDLEKIEVEAEGAYFVGDSTTVTAVTTGKTEGLKYKFVQRNGDDWSDWKVIQEFDTNNTVSVDITKAGNCTIYVDIMDTRGVVFDAETIVITGHEYLSAKAGSSKVTVNKSVTVFPNLSGNPKGAKYKYVWQKDNWASWGVISDFTSKSSIQWTPTSVGKYYIYIDVELNGVVKTKSVAVEVTKKKNGWYYENGYKYYYVDDKKVEDVRNIIGPQKNYVIKVNKQMSCVTVYAKDGNNGYIIPVVAFACSPGSGTPTGTFYTQNKYRWHQLFGADGQYCTRIVDHILFHSPPYTSFDNHTLIAKEYNKLGTWASKGCIRLRTGDAKWIYDNCGLGTKVVIYNSSVAGPFSKPVYAKIPLSQKWDPTDPYA